jgi:hypothetical protein
MSILQIYLFVSFPENNLIVPFPYQLSSNAHSVTGTLMMYLYYQGLHSEQAKLDSKYYQRFIAKKDEGHH